MGILRWLRLLILEERLKFGAFGKYNRYRCWCLERKVKTIGEKLCLAREVLTGPGVSLAESRHNVDFIRKHSVAARKATTLPAKDAPTMNPELHQTGL
jgi:hypothetical protein